MLYGVIIFIAILVFVLCFKVNDTVLKIFRIKYDTEYKKVQYHEDCRLKIEEPVRPIPVNEQVIRDIEEIKGKLTGIEISKGIKRRN